MDKVKILLHQYDTAWDAAKYWATDLNRLTYWFALIYAAAVSVVNMKQVFALPFLAIGLAIWTLLYNRGIHWYRTNMTELRTLGKALQDSGYDLHLYALDKPASWRPTGRLGNIGWHVVLAVLFTHLFLAYAYVISVTDTTAVVFEGDRSVNLAIWVASILITVVGTALRYIDFRHH